jgi:hypothetical protein
MSTSSVSSAILDLPNAVVKNLIFPNLSLPELGTCSRVCKVWRELAKKQISTFSYEKAFGPKEWFIYFGDHLRNVPRLPPNITEIMNSSCLFWPDKKVHETHVLVLIPETVNGQPLNLKLLGEIVQKPLQGYAAKYSYFNSGKYVEQPAQSHWALVTRTVIEGSRNKTYDEDHDLLDQYSQNIKITYEIPTLLDATVCNFMEYIRCGTWLYGENPLTYTWCQEKYNAGWYMISGGGSDSGLLVSYYRGDGEDRGVGGCRKFEATKY